MNFMTKNDKSDNKKEKEVYVPKSTAELLQFACIDKEMFYMTDKSYMDIFQITTKDLMSASESEVELDMLQWEKFYKMYSSDCKIIGINFPTDTILQQQYYQHRIITTKSPIFRDILLKKYDELVEVNLDCTDRQYYLMIFCKTYEKYLHAKGVITVTLINSGLLSEISEKKKISIITKLCNKSTSIYG